MKLRIDSANAKDLNMGNYLKRALFVNMILSNLVSIIFIYTLNKETFITLHPKISSVLSVFLLVTLLFMMYREDGRGLHDLMANTIVISTKELRSDVTVENEVKDAKVIEEKEIKEEKPKKTTKKKTKKEVKK